MKRMKIVHAISGLPKCAGTTVFCVKLAEEQVKLGHRVCVIVKEFACERDAVPEGCEVVVWKPGVPLPFEPDIVHSHTPWVWWAHQVHAWARGRGCGIVQSTHGSYSPWAMKHKRLKKFLPWHLWQRNDLARAAALHTTAHLETEQLRALGFKNPIIEAPLGTDLPQRMADFSDPDKTLLFVGRIYPVKGLDLLIRAWAEIKDVARANRWCIKLVGPDQSGYVQTLKDLCADVGLSVGEDVVFTGPLFDDAKDKAYLDARALILPSYTENFGDVVVDAMGHGLPVLTSENTPWNFLSEKGCGWHFPTKIEDVVSSLKVLSAASDEQLKAMGRKGRRLVEEAYAWEPIAKKMVDAYACLSGRASPGKELLFR